MSQFYVSEHEKNRAQYYRDIAAIPKRERTKIVKSAEAACSRYLMGGSNHREYDENRSATILYAKPTKELLRYAADHDRRAEEALHNELKRCRDWLIAAFKLNKELKANPQWLPEIREHNLFCARQWVTARWPEYKAARKVVLGF